MTLKAEAAELVLSRRKARANFLDFVRFTFGDDFRESWHHKVVADKLEQFAKGNIKRLAITMPPRHTKSEFVSRRFPAYLFGINPDAKIISCSYGADLASMMNRDVQRILDSPEYKEVFPNTTLSGSNVRTAAHESYLRNSDIFEVVGHKGVYKCAGVGGPITGFGFDYGIIDDPIKNRADAESQTYRDKLWEWYSSTFRTRKQKGAAILITLTRWHEDDLLGRILDLADKNPDADQFEVISLPALSEETLAPYDQRTGPDQALWENEFSKEDLLTTKATSTLYDWLALFQQQPSSASGNLVKREHFKYCTLSGDLLDLGDGKKFILPHCKIFQTCDPAASKRTSADYFCLGTWVRTPTNDLALIDVIKIRMEAPKNVPLFNQQYIRWHPIFQAVEKNGLGISLYQYLMEEGLPIKELDADADKLTRFIPAATRISAGAVYFLADAPWLHDYETTLLKFPSVAHDEEVDITSYAVQLLIEGKWSIDNFSLSSIATTKSR
jgi:predicted phage terminase large subunit-like protein